MTQSDLAEPKILIVDDEIANVELLEMLLGRAGFTNLKSTTDSRRVIAIYREFDPDVILLDLSMPHLDGFEIMAQLRALIAAENYVPILVLTAMVTSEAKRKALSSGAHDFLTKPFDTTEVVLRVKNLLHTRQLHLQLQRYSESLEQTVKERTLELREALEELKGTQQQVVQQERMRALGVMASGVAHDFNNVLSVVLGFGELVLSDCDSNPAFAHNADPLRAIITSAEDGARMVARLAEFNRPEATETRVPVDFNALVKQAIALTEPRWKTQALGRGVTIKVRADWQEIPPVAGDPAELREALTNLIFNAVDAMPQGGTISTRTRHDGEHVVLEVADTGTGMSEEVRQRCLEPFFTTKGDKGTGLGLAMVYGIILRHGGTMSIESEPGKGTRFLFRLPAAIEGAVDAGESPIRLDEPLRILIVDDQLVLLDILREYLEQDGHSVTSAINGADALKAFKENAFELVITDQSMPGMSGDQLAAAIRQVKLGQRIIMLTGFGDSAEFDAYSPESVDLIISKPVSLINLRRAIVSAVSSRLPPVTG